MRTVALDDELAALLQQDKPLDLAVREALVMDLFRREKISSGKSAGLLGISRLDVIRHASRLGIAYIDMLAEEWEAGARAGDPLRRCRAAADRTAPRGV
ncbi:MAG TPA: UPF0175 family protein [Vicinamibacteria bacterium]|nr:UPF0175 family protein [Vicinamibacteria bacterium]